MAEAIADATFDVVSIDPGTVNLAACRLRYDKEGDTVPTTVEQFLARITVQHVGYTSLKTNHIPTADARFRMLVQHDWTWMTDPVCAVVIEQQGSQRSPIQSMCYAMHGFFLGVQCARNAEYHTVYLDFPAIKKFQGPWIRVCAKDGERMDLNYESERDPVKRAAIELCERMLSWMKVACDQDVLRQGGQHTCDAIVQGVSYLFQRVLPVKHTLVVKNPTATDITNDIRRQPRAGRKHANRTQGFRNKKGTSVA